MRFRNALGLLVGCLYLLLVTGCTEPVPEVLDAVPASVSDVELGSGRPMLVDLGADECVPCKLMKPILDGMVTEYKGQMDVVFIDVWKHRDQASRFQVRMIPTQIFYDEEGRELFRRSGFIGKEDILATWERLGYPF